MNRLIIFAGILAVQILMANAHAGLSRTDNVADEAAPDAVVTIQATNASPHEFAAHMMNTGIVSHVEIHDYNKHILMTAKGEQSAKTVAVFAKLRHMYKLSEWTIYLMDHNQDEALAWIE